MWTRKHTHTHTLARQMSWFNNLNRTHDSPTRHTDCWGDQGVLRDSVTDCTHFVGLWSQQIVKYFNVCAKNERNCLDHVMLCAAMQSFIINHVSSNGSLHWALEQMSHQFPHTKYHINAAAGFYTSTKQRGTNTRSSSSFEPRMVNLNPDICQRLQTIYLVDIDLHNLVFMDNLYNLIAFFSPNVMYTP